MTIRSGFVLLLVLLPASAIYELHMSFTRFGMEFRAVMNIQQLLITMEATKMRCAIRCNQLIACRTLDYDSVSRRCRLFEGDGTTGSIVASESTHSVVGTVRIVESLFSSIHTQACLACQQTRYEICSTNVGSCQCPAHTYWNGLTCALQLFINQTCSYTDACRIDLGLTCLLDCYGNFQRCNKITSSGM
jgi:hypothetical protein